MTRRPQELERVGWGDLSEEFYSSWGWPNGKWEPEHVAIVGPTGSGKSMLQCEILKVRAQMRDSHAVVIATKPADKTMKAMGWPIVNSWPPPWGKHERVIFWPKAGKPAEGVGTQRIAIARMLNDLWKQGANVIVAFDEIAYIEQELRLKVITDRYWREARSVGITLVAGTQRPRNVSRYMWSEPSWTFAFAPQDEDEGRRTAEIIGGRTRMYDSLMNLRRYEFIVTNRRERIAYISKLGT